MITYNSFGFDLPYLVYRSKKFGITPISLKNKIVDIYQIIKPVFNHSLEDLTSLFNIKTTQTKFKKRHYILLWSNSYPTLQKYLAEDNLVLKKIVDMSLFED